MQTYFVVFRRVDLDLRRWNVVGSRFGRNNFGTKTTSKVETLLHTYKINIRFKQCSGKQTLRFQARADSAYNFLRSLHEPEARKALPLLPKAAASLSVPYRVPTDKAVRPQHVAFGFVFVLRQSAARQVACLEAPL